MLCGIGAIFRNEAPYILEWLAWHRMLGITRFVICDNASDDGSTQLLAALDRLGILRHVPFPDPSDARPQIPAYRHILRHHAARLDWLAFIDADEFLMPTGVQGLTEMLGQIPDDADAIAVNWAVFGTSGLKEPDDPVTPAPVLARFTRRAARDHPVNRNVKTILRPARFTDPRGVGIHVFQTLAGDARYVSPSGKPRPELPARDIATAVTWDGLRVNHYITKSLTEFLYKKRGRGNAAETMPRPVTLLEEVDRNECPDMLGPEVLDALHREVSALRELLTREGLAGWRPDALPRSMTAPQPVWQVERLLRSARSGRLMVEGWFIGTEAVPTVEALGLDCRLNGQPLLPIAVIRTVNARIAQSHGTPPLCGFQIVLQNPGLPVDLDRASLIFTIRHDGQEVLSRPLSGFEERRRLPAML